MLVQFPPKAHHLGPRPRSSPGVGLDGFEHLEKGRRDVPDVFEDRPNTAVVQRARPAEAQQEPRRRKRRTRRS